MTTGTLAFIIFAAILAQAIILPLIGRYRRRRSPQTDGSRGQAPGVPVSKVNTGTGVAWSGFREFVVQRRVSEARDGSICSFYLAPVDAQPLPAFRPGQFLTFRLPGTAGSGQAGGLVRCYSLSDAHRADCYRVTIKRVPPPPESPAAPPGVSSGFFHDHVQPGDRLLVKAPSGHFHLDDDGTLPIVLIGGGIGITPMLSIVNTVIGRDPGREVWLFYGVRNGGEHVMKAHLESLAATHDRLHLHVCYSAPGQGDVEGVDYHHEGRVSIPLLRSTLKLGRYQFYVCGPRPMMESLVPGLEQLGVDSGDIHYESFGPATLSRSAQAASATLDSKPVQVSFRRSGKTVTWGPAAGSLLELAESNAIEVDSGCRAGSCGSCQTRLTSGEVEYSQVPDADIEPGHCLLCIAMPRSDLVLEA